MGAPEEQWVLCAAPQGFPTEQQGDAGSWRLLAKADQCGPNKGMKRSPKPGLPPCHPEEEQQQGEGHFLSVDSKQATKDGRDGAAREPALGAGRGGGQEELSGPTEGTLSWTVD